jgi:putative phosphoesterase
VRVGVISDTHIHNEAELETLKRIFKDYFSDIDLLLHAGDLVDLSVYNWLNQQVDTVAVRGNMDHPDVLKTLPEIRVIEAGGFRIGLAHGQGSPNGLVERIKGKFELAGNKGKLDCIVHGHTHWAVNKIIDDTLFFNPGSPTDTRFAPYNSVGFLEIGKKIEGTIKRM